MIIKVENLTVKYECSTIIKSASFEVVEGDFVCVVGANGAGKSTLIKTILGLIKPTHGKITFGSGLKATDVGVLPQDNNIARDFPATVWEIVLSGTLNRMGVRWSYRDSERALAQEALSKLNIIKLKNKSFSDLSGGERQKVLLARALAASSKLLILDEPSNNLDYKSRKEFYQILTKLNQAGLTIIMITHDLDTEDLIGNKVLSINNSEVCMNTTTKYLESYR